MICSTSVRNMCLGQFKFFTTLHMLVDVYENATRIYIGIKNEFYGIDEFPNMEFMNNEDQRYVSCAK